MSRWFRWYEGTCEDGKLRVTARNAGVTLTSVIAVWALMLESASKVQHRGICTLDSDYIEAILDLEAGAVDLIAAAMRGLEMIEASPEGIRIINWGKRQFQTDTKDATNAERQQRHRDKHKANGSVTARNGNVTELKRTEKETKTDTETDKKKVSCALTRTARDKDWEKFKQAYPKRKGSNPWPPAYKIFLSALQQGATVDEMVAALAAGVGYDKDKV